MDFLEYSTFICSGYQFSSTFYDWDSDKYSDGRGADKKFSERADREDMAAQFQTSIVAHFHTTYSYNINMHI